MPLSKLNSLEHSKIVKDLNHKKLLHLIHKQFRESDRVQKHQELEEKRRRDDLLPTASSTTSTLAMSQSAPHLQMNQMNQTQQMIEEIKYHTQTQRRQHLSMSRTNFSNVLETARHQVSKLPFSPLRHKKFWYKTAGSLNTAARPKGGVQDISEHYVGEFTDQWFDRDKNGLQQFLTSPTKDRTRMTRDEFFAACVHSTESQHSNKQQQQQQQQQQTATNSNKQQQTTTTSTAPDLLTSTHCQTSSLVTNAHSKLVRQ